MGKQTKIAGEDYFRVLKENKEINSNLKQKKTLGAGVSKAKFEAFDSVTKRPSPEKHPHDPYAHISPDMEDEEALQLIEVPEDKLYIIDKVLRQMAKQGPIGVENSELINIEYEDEYKESNQ